MEEEEEENHWRLYCDEYRRENRNHGDHLIRPPLHDKPITLVEQIPACESSKVLLSGKMQRIADQPTVADVAVSPLGAYPVSAHNSSTYPGRPPTARFFTDAFENKLVPTSSGSEGLVGTNTTSRPDAAMLPGNKCRHILQKLYVTIYNLRSAADNRGSVKTPRELQLQDNEHGGVSGETQMGPDHAGH
ncbi:hypothetical protein P7K49_030814 [Saguinus oedipus]|uniref:Uncharacterized protein n=1 Tax=Saguinus oedipus TaxID=9490 RepID=A0ABQ9U426_SAGOE|nr:hypothetical protein P7K49_030814 [Saguinus oedipus]